MNPRGAQKVPRLQTIPAGATRPQRLSERA